MNEKSPIPEKTEAEKVAEALGIVLEPGEEINLETLYEIQRGAIDE